MYIDLSVIVEEQVILLASLEFHVAESLSVFETLDGIDAQHGIAQGSMKFPEDRLSQSRGASFDDTADDSSDGITFAFDPIDIVCHFFGQFLIRTAHRILLDAAQVILGIILVQLVCTDLCCKGRDGDAELFQCQLGQCTGYDTRNGFACR